MPVRGLIVKRADLHSTEQQQAEFVKLETWCYVGKKQFAGPAWQLEELLEEVEANLILDRIVTGIALERHQGRESFQVVHLGGEVPSLTFQTTNSKITCGNERQAIG